MEFLGWNQSNKKVLLFKVRLDEIIEEYEDTKWLPGVSEVPGRERSFMEVKVYVSVRAAS